MEEKKPKAAALKYDRRHSNAPILLAKGEGILAEKIVEVAKEHGIPVLEDPTLVELLVKLEPGEEIPEELYEAVARVLAFVYSVIRRELPSG